MYTDVSVITTPTTRVYPSPRDWRIYVCVTGEMTLRRPHPSPPSSLTDVHKYIGYRNSHWQSLTKSSSRSRGIMSFGFFHVWSGLVSPSWPPFRLDPLLASDSLLFLIIPTPIYIYSVVSSTTVAWRSPHSSNPRLTTFSLRLHLYGLKLYWIEYWCHTYSS